MQLQATHQLTGLLGAVLLSAGLGASFAQADQSTKSVGSTTPVEGVEEHAGEQGSDRVKLSPEKMLEEEEMVEVRISLPDGRTIVRLEPVGKTSAKRTRSIGLRVSKTLPDGSRVSYGTSGVTGGGGASFVARSGGGGSQASSGGGGGGSSFSAGGALSSPGGGGAARGASQAYAGLGGLDGADNAESSSSSGRAVHTIGDPIYNDDGAVGGQRVEFHGAGMGAAVIGNTVYFIGAEVVQADQPFEIIDGTRIGSDSVMQIERNQSSGGDLMSSWNTAGSPIKIDFASGTVVDLVMLSLPADANNPVREQRTWRVRIR